MKKLLLLLMMLVAVVTTVTWVRYGGGEPYPNLASAPLISESGLERVLSYREPVGNVAVTPTGRIFFTVHPESRTRGNKLLEFVDGAAEPWPDGRAQQLLFDTPLGVTADAAGRLWVLDHGNHGLRQPRLLGFDIESGKLVADERFGSAIAPAGSLLKDLAISPDGRTLVMSDASFWRQRPALIVYDTRSGSTRRVLEGHPSVTAEDFVIRSNGREMAFLGGIVAMRGGVTGVAVDPEWLYYGAMSGSAIYRVPLADLRNRTLPDSQLAARVERVASKPLSESLGIDGRGNLYVTDIEHNAIHLVGPDRRPRTLLRSESLRWPDGLAVASDGWVYVSDSALSELVLRSAEDIEAARPFAVFRFRPNQAAAPGE
jgi:sugar lactone lactonase YvrE